MNGRKAGQQLDEAMLLDWVAISWFMGVINLRRRSSYWSKGTRLMNSAAMTSRMSQTAWEYILSCFRDCGFEPYSEGDLLPDGRRALSPGDEPYSFFRKFGDLKQSFWRRNFEPGLVLTSDETVVGYASVRIV